MLTSIIAYAATTAIAVIGLYVVYVIPVYLRLRDKDFRVGPWNLGRWSNRSVDGGRLVGIDCVLLILATTYPITGSNFNYTIVAVAVVLGGASIWWAPSAKNWFTGRAEHRRWDARGRGRRAGAT